jgi:hypothetical protein
MAMFPCSVGNHRYQGPQQSAYLGAVNGTRTERVKKRLCPQHAQGLIAVADELLEELDVNAPPSSNPDAASQRCFRCSGDAPDWALFVNIYPLKQEPRVWFGKSCAADINEFLAVMDLVP